MSDYIKSVRIVNFQSLGDVTLDLSPRTTSITGPNDTGKSAVVRFLRAVCSNQMPSAWIRRGKGTTGGEITTTEGKLRWFKGETNSYELEIGGHVQEFKKMGREVPPEVKAFLKISPVEAGTDKIWWNFLGQWDLPFLITASGSVLSQVLGTISGIDTVFNSIRTVAGEHRQLKIAYESQEEDLAKLKADQATRIAIDTARNTLFKETSNLFKELTAAFDRLDSLEKLSAELAQLSSAYKNCISIQQTYAGLEELLNLVSTTESQMSKLRSMDAIWTDYSSTSSKFGILSSEATKYSSLSELSTDLAQISGSLARLAELESLYCRYYDSVVEEGLLKTKLETATEGVAEVTREFSTIKSCPLCNRPIEACV